MRFTTWIKYVIRLYLHKYLHKPFYSIVEPLVWIGSKDILFWHLSLRYEEFLKAWGRILRLFIYFFNFSISDTSRCQLKTFSQLHLHRFTRLFVKTIEKACEHLFCRRRSMSLGQIASLRNIGTCSTTWRMNRTGYENRYCGIFRYV